MASKFFIQVGDVAKPLDMAQVEQCVRWRGHMALDYLAVQTTERLVNDDQWPEGSDVLFFMQTPDGNPLVLFRGALRDPDSFAAWRGMGHRYLIAGPWERFERTPFTQTWQAFPADSERVPTGDPKEPVELSRAFLWDGKDTAQQIEAVVDLLLADQGPGDTPITPIAKGTIDAAIELAPSKIGSAFCGEVVFRSLKLLPRACFWFDYTTTAPTFHCRNFQEMDRITVPLGAAESFRAKKQTQLAFAYVRLAMKSQYAPPNVETTGNTTLTSTTVSALGDTSGISVEMSVSGNGIPDGATVVSVGSSSVVISQAASASGTGVAITFSNAPLQTVVKVAQSPNPYSGRKFGGLDHTFDDTEFWQLEQAQALADFLYQENSSAPWSGQHVLPMREEWLRQLRPGLRYCVSGAREAHATMDGVVQSVSDDFRTKRTTVVFGPPIRMGPQDALERLRGLRNLPTPAGSEKAEPAQGTIPGYTKGHEKAPANDPKQPKIPEPRDGKVVLVSQSKVLGWVDVQDGCS